MKTLKITFVLLLLAVKVFATATQQIVVTMKNGTKHQINFENYTISGRGIETNKGEVLDYIKVKSISTADFNAYKRATKISGRKGNRHIEVNFTGDENLYALEMEHLKGKRDNAHAARGAGGLLAIIGAISGDRDLYNVGMVTYGVGTIAKDINTENTLDVQNEAIQELQEKQNQPSEEDQLRAKYGNENYDAVIALVHSEHDRALALANAGETSKDANHRLSAMYVRALIAADMDDQEMKDKAFEKMIIFDPEVENKEVAQEATDEMLKELKALRKAI